MFDTYDLIYILVPAVLNQLDPKILILLDISAKNTCSLEVDEYSYIKLSLVVFKIG